MQLCSDLHHNVTPLSMPQQMLQNFSAGAAAAAPQVILAATHYHAVNDQ
jgi:hypothetical protein